VVISPFVLHRHPGFWERPEAFDPARFAGDPAVNLSRPAYLPFGAGPHQCIGNSFAMMEARIILAMVAQRYRLRLLPGHAVEPKPGITLRPRHGLWMTAEPATD
jgi:cytochrome P450